MNLEPMIELARDHAARVLVGKKGAQIPPTFCVLFKNRPPATMVAPWSNQQQREVFLSSIEQAFKTYRADIIGYSVVSEAWTAEQAHPPQPGDRPPSERDDRKEVVFVLATDGEETLVKRWDIVRDDHAMVTRLDEDTGFITDQIGGRMAKLLAPARETAT